MALVVGLVTAVIFDQWVVHALKSRNGRPLYIAVGTIVVLGLILLIFADWQQQHVVFPEYQREYDNYLRGLRGG